TSLNSTRQAEADDFPTVRGGLRAGVSQLPGYRFLGVDNSQISALFPYHEQPGHNPCYGTVFDSVTGLVISDEGWCLSKVRCGVFPFGRTASVLLGTCSPGLGMVFTR